MSGLISVIPRVSVVLRNRNEDHFLRQVLPAIRAQEYPQPIEIIVVDNTSVDGSAETARANGCKVVPLEHFTYGRGLNVGIEAATGEAIVLLSAHSLPLGNDFIAKAVAPLADPLIAAVRCMIAGKPENVQWLAPEVLTWPVDVSTMVSRGPIASGCVIRRSAWETVKFDEQAIASEDKLWAMRICQMGYGIFSPAPAYYAYLKRDLPLEKSLREMSAVYHATGARLGHLQRSRGQAVGSLLRTMFFSAPRAAASLIAREARIAQFCWKNR